MSKYQYWTLIEKVGEKYKDKMKVGELISSDYKKEHFERINIKTGEVNFQCSGTYICRTLKNIPVNEKIKIIKEKMRCLENEI